MVSSDVFINETIGIISLPLTEKYYTKGDVIPNFPNVDIAGEENKLYISDSATTKKMHIQIKGNDNKIIIGSNTSLSGVISITGNNLTVFIGAHTTFQSVKIFCKGTGHGVYIGRDCMFSAEIEIRTSDAHSIISLDENKKINTERGIYIGDHVWLSKRSLVQKGSVIPADNIIGFGSMVNKELKGSNQIFAGIPVKLVKEGVTWSRKAAEAAALKTLNDWKSYSYI